MKEMDMYEVVMRELVATCVNDAKDYPTLLSIADVKKLMDGRLSDAQVRALFKDKDFPTVKFGNIYFVSKVGFFDWLIRTARTGQKHIKTDN